MFLPLPVTSHNSCILYFKPVYPGAFTDLRDFPWLDVIRASRVGYLVLGSTFNWPDPFAYLAGIAIGFLMESLRVTGRSTSAGGGS
ncbi:MAG: DUF2809 domain-containing protein [Gloeobacteraceae cyanobacterium ES-bin-144]|nr:DUF2809 domain-containing protein [Verrucomicrobiales bacterium]